ncbi:MAG: sulfatase-like hydrolase/transferase [Planctomycetota bacterium]
MSASTPAAASPPNFLYIMCDELRWCELGCYGHPHIKTPNLDRLAARGTRFETAVSNCAVCMPARSIALSGQYARKCCGMLTNVAWHPEEGGWLMPQWPTDTRPHLPDPTLPELLQQAGYRTAAIGKWHVEAWPDAIGFDHFVIPAHQHANTSQWYIENGGQPFVAPCFGVDYEADRAAEFFNQAAQGDQPFYLYFNPAPPHMPLADAPRKYLDMYSREDVVIRGNVDLEQMADSQWLHTFRTYLWDYRHYRDNLPYTHEWENELDLIELHRLYMGLTTWVDDTVGKLLEALDTAGLADDTVVVFTADHGDNLGSHGLMGKTQLNDESMRIPILVAGPGISSQVHADSVASLVDVPTTFLALAGQPKPDHFHGRDFADVLHATAPAAEPRYAIVESVSQGLGLRTPTHSLGIPWDDLDQWQLGDTPDQFFDVTQDEFELHNLADDEDSRTIRDELHATLKSWHESIRPMTPPRIRPPK